MRTVKAEAVTEALAKVAMNANYDIGEEMLRAFDEALAAEQSEAGKEVIRQIQENARIARAECVPYCQDTGFAVVFAEVGQEVHVEGNLTDAINAGIRKAYTEGYLRKSILNDPIQRKNTGDNTPAVIHYEVVPGDKIRLTFGAKGGGSENMSRQAMLKPADGLEGVKRFVVQTVSEGGANACPPLVIGVGIGGTFEKSCILAKKAAMRSPYHRNPDPFYAALEDELKDSLNKLGIGPMGYGGTVTVLGVNIETYPCHLVALPVAVNVNCHADRHGEVEI
ncbi:MAG: fumarate hydratase [Acidobacteriota bacterium]